MSVHTTRHERYEVRYRDQDGRNRSRTFSNREDAFAFDDAIKRQKEQARADAALNALNEGTKP